MKEKFLYRFNIALIVVGVLTAMSSILLECIAGKDFMNITFRVWVWLHIIICLSCLSMVIYHLYIHWGNLSNWFRKVRNLNSGATKWLSWLSLITFLSGIIVAVIFITGAEHNPLGGIHGKVGLVVILISIFHTKKRFRWFKNRKQNKAFKPVIDQDKCIKCAKCIKKCPAKIFRKENKSIIINDPLYCLQCMKCVSHCPKNAIS